MSNRSSAITAKMAAQCCTNQSGYTSV